MWHTFWKVWLISVSSSQCVDCVVKFLSAPALFLTPPTGSEVCFLPAGLNPREVCPSAAGSSLPCCPRMGCFNSQFYLLSYTILCSLLYFFHHAPSCYQQKCYQNASSFTIDGSVAGTSLLQSLAELSTMSNCRS